MSMTFTAERPPAQGRYLVFHKKVVSVTAAYARYWHTVNWYMCDAEIIGGMQCKSSCFFRFILSCNNRSGVVVVLVHSILQEGVFLNEHKARTRKGKNDDCVGRSKVFPTEEKWHAVHTIYTIALDIIP